MIHPGESWVNPGVIGDLHTDVQHERLDAVASMGMLQREAPRSVVENLDPKYDLRPYQVEAFARFLHCYHHEYPGKAWPLHSDLTTEYDPLTGLGRFFLSVVHAFVHAGVHFSVTPCPYNTIIEYQGNTQS